MAEERRATLDLPPPEVLREIEAKQHAKAKEIQARRQLDNSTDERDEAAKLIQKSYRGSRTRRALDGYGLDSSTRWVEVGCILCCVPFHG